MQPEVLLIRIPEDLSQLLGSSSSELHHQLQPVQIHKVSPDRLMARNAS